MIRALAFCLLASPLAAQVAEPEDYKTDHYRSPVPTTLSGAIVVSTEAAHALWSTDRVAFVDVWPRPPKPANLPKGTIFREPKRQSIPGSIWLPNVGYGALAAVTDDYFQRGLTEVTNGDLDMPVVVFCLADCWMSWNAAKRAMTYGYTHVYWYPDGTDGWDFDDLPLVQVKAFPEPDQ